MKLQIDVSDEVAAKLKEIGKEANVSTEAACRIILEGFTAEKAGRIYTGQWYRGNVGENKGFRFVVQWPLRSGFLKIKGDIVAKMGGT